MSNEPIRFPGESVEYRAARDELLTAEINLRAQIEAVAAQRRALPRGGEVPEDYVFEELDEDGRVVPVRLSELFAEQDTLVLYNLMYGPDMEAPCASCSSIVDSFDGNIVHIEPRTAIAFVAKSPIHRIHAWAANRGWCNVRLISSRGNSFNADYHGENAAFGQMPMMNVFVQEDGRVVHFWGSEMLYAPVDGHPRHVDLLWPIWNVFDLLPQGRGGKDHPRRNYD